MLQQKAIDSIGRSRGPNFLRWSAVLRPIVPELAEIMGVNHKTIRELIAAGKIREIRLGRVIRVARSEVLKLLGE